MKDRIVVDTSAVIAVIFGEDDAEDFADRLDAHAGRIAITEVTRFEMRVVVDAQRGVSGVARLDALLNELDVAWVDVDDQITTAAIAAWQTFGKGRHPARLNLGDCFSYALSKHLGAPLLYKGDDFAQTDVEAVMPTERPETT